LARAARGKSNPFPSRPHKTSSWFAHPFKLQNIKSGIEGKPVSWYSDVFDLVFPDIDAAQANSRWKKELAKPPKEEREDEDDE
jgi:Lon-like ATP-dependent protease